MLSLTSLRNKCVDGDVNYEFVNQDPISVDGTQTPVVGKNASTLGVISRRITPGFYHISAHHHFTYDQSTTKFCLSAVHMSYLLKFDTSVNSQSGITIFTTNSYYSNSVLFNELVYIPENIGNFEIVMQPINFDGNFIAEGESGSTAGLNNMPTYTRVNTYDKMSLRRLF